MTKVEILQQKGHNFLWIDDALWMWDIPIERRLQKEIANKAYGSVLVAGYGLGLVQKYLLENPNVKSIFTVELSSEVIEECKKVYGKIHGEIIIGDFNTYQTNDKFDCIVGDVWQEMVPEFLDEYKEFKARAQQLVKPGGRILAWGQDFFEYLLDSKGMEVH